MVDRRTIVLVTATVAAMAGVGGLLLETARSESPETRPTAPPVIEGKPAPVAPKAPAAPAVVPKSTRPVPSKATPKPTGAPAADGVAAKSGGPTGAWEASLAEREAALARTQTALLAQLGRLEELQAAIEARWREADQLQKLAASRWTAATLTTPEGVIHLPAAGAEREAQLQLVAAILKKMKPAAAAALAQQWDDALGADMVARLSPRSSSPILAAMEPEHAARITRILARVGAPTPIRGEP